MKNGVIMVTVAHRGAESISPENTEVAFNPIECISYRTDVQLTKTASAVVHDYKLKRYNKKANCSESIHF